LLNEKIKHVMYGAGLQLSTKFASSAIWNNAQKQTTPYNPAPAWYQPVYGYPLDDVVLDLGLPAVLGIVGIATKKQMIKDMAIGAALSGLGTFLQVFMNRTSMYPWLPFRAQASTNCCSASASARGHTSSAQTRNGMLFV
jgi:hypothetical protein